jgi:hypothetical protein
MPAQVVEQRQTALNKKFEGSNPVTVVTWREKIVLLFPTHRQAFLENLIGFKFKKMPAQVVERATLDPKF